MTTDQPRSKHARDLRVWTILGQLRDDVVRDIASRIRQGQRYDEISAAHGISRYTGRRKCAEIATLIRVPVERKQHDLDCEEVMRRVDRGEDDRTIAAAMGRTADSVSAIRRKHGLRYFTQLRISKEENAAIERGLLAGESTRAVAAAVGCHQADVQRRRQRIAHTLSKDLPPCKCGKPRNHGGRCNSVIDSATIRERLIAGKTATDIAREFNRTAQSFKPKYVQPVIDQLTAEGHLCGCGKPFGHRFVCTMTMAPQRCTFSDADRSQASKMIRDGASVAQIKASLSLTTYSATVLAREVRSMLAVEGVRCRCGKPINHKRPCTPWSQAAAQRMGFRFTCAAAANMSIKGRRHVSKLAREGWKISVIVKRTGESEWRVTQMVQELDRAGHLPSKCAGCDLPRGHRSICPKPKLCSCGRPRNHRGACRRADGRKNVAETKLTGEQLADLKRRYRSRQSIRGISRDTGISFSVVQRQISRLRERAAYKPGPCACGRPAWHGGSCWVNKNGVIGKRHLSHIERGILAGATSHTLAEQLKLSVATVLKRSLPIRDRLFEQGTRCACGRQLNHRYWCSARWDAHGLPRGRRPLSKDLHQCAVEALLRGEPLASIASGIAVSVHSLVGVRLSLTEEQRRERARAVRRRIAQNSDAEGAALMTRVERLVPRGVVGPLRDDVVAELYLAVIEGRLEPEQLPAAIKSFVSRGYSEWQSAFGPRSLDEQLSEGDTRTLSHAIGDTTAVLGIEDITIGGNEP